MFCLYAFHGIVRGIAFDDWCHIHNTRNGWLMRIKLGVGMCFCRNGSRSRWRHKMETFSALLALCDGNSPVTDGSTFQRPVARSFGVFFYLRLKIKRVEQTNSTCQRRDQQYFDLSAISLYIYYYNNDGVTRYTRYNYLALLRRWA